MKNFSTQFRECRKAGIAKNGSVVKFKDHPELLPIFPRKAVLAVAAKMKEDPDFGFEEILCLKFGGVCSSGNKECKTLRKVEGYES